MERKGDKDPGAAPVVAAHLVAFRPAARERRPEEPEWRALLHDAPSLFGLRSEVRSAAFRRRSASDFGSSSLSADNSALAFAPSPP